jgi:hypothetical protein
VYLAGNTPDVPQTPVTNNDAVLLHIILQFTVNKIVS